MALKKLHHKTQLFIAIGGRDIYDNGLTIDRPIFEHGVDVFVLLPLISLLIAILSTFNATIHAIRFWANDIPLRIKVFIYILTLAIEGGIYVQAKT